MTVRALAALLAALALASTAAAAPAVSGTRAKAFVTELAALGPRPAGSANERRGARMVADQLRALGYEVSIQTFSLPRGGISRNVVATTGGTVRAIVVAHVDGVSEGPAANDNASGVAAMLEVARALKGKEGVLVAALGAEERVETGSHLHLGSVRLLRSLSAAERAAVRVALSLDMVGFGPTLNVRGIEASPNASARLALDSAERLRLPASYLRDSGQSDHAEMSRAGLPAAWVEWRWDPCWHSPCDTAARVKTWKLGAAARLALATARAALAAN